MRRRYLIEGSIVEDSQQLCLGRGAIGLPDFHRPFLLLSGGETVAERLPFHIELMFPHGCFDDSFLPIDHSIPDKGESHADARSIFRPVGERAVVHLIVESERAALESLVVRKKIIDHKHVFERGAQLNIHLTTIIGELGVALGETFPGECRRPLCLIIDDEETSLHRVIGIHRIQRVFPSEVQSVAFRQSG